MMTDIKLLKKNIKVLRKLFEERNISEDDIIPVDDRKGYLTDDDMAMFVPKTKTLRDALLARFDVEEARGLPEITRGGRYTGKYRGKYLSIIMDLMAEYFDVEVSVSEDAPLVVETEDFIFYLAPCMRD